MTNKHWQIGIAWRYLFSKNTTQAVNIMSKITMLSMVVISFAFIVILSVFNGFEDLISKLINTFNPELKIEIKEGKLFNMDIGSIDKIKSLKEVEVVSMTIEENVLLRNSSRQMIAHMKGVDAAFEQSSQVDSAIVNGKYLVLEKNDIVYCVVGVGVEQTMGIDVRQPLADLDIYVPNPQAQSINQYDAFRVQTILPTGAFAIQEDFDANYIIIPLAKAQYLLNAENKYSAMEVKLKQISNIKQVQQEIKAIVGDSFTVKTQPEQDEDLYKIMKLESWMVFALLTLVLIIASFNITSSLSMLVIDKLSDAATLTALGAAPNQVAGVFRWVGVLMAAISAMIGTLLGVIVCLLQQHFHFIKLSNTQSFVIDAYPVSVRLTNVILVILLVLFVAFVASWIPSYKLKKTQGLSYMQRT